MNEIPKCRGCNQPMFEIGGIGKMIRWDKMIKVGIENTEIMTSGVCEQKLYQCPECKEVKLN